MHETNKVIPETETASTVQILESSLLQISNNEIEKENNLRRLTSHQKRN